jgi:chaperone required for assembly of F1-ATPase
VKRFWDRVSVVTDDAGFRILLDDRPINIPGAGVLRVGPSALAEAVAEEWRIAGGGKGGEMSFADTPLTRLAGTAHARIALDPAPTWDAIARYGETDLLCYRAESPRELVLRQSTSWQPWLDWAAATFGASLRVTIGVVPIKQHHDAVDLLRRVVTGYDAYMLAGLGVAVPALGSLVLGLALAEARLSASEAHELAALDELFQVEQWGEDAEAAKRRDTVAADIALAERFMRLVR